MLKFSNILPPKVIEDELRWRTRNRPLPIDEEGLPNFYVGASYYLNLENGVELNFSLKNVRFGTPAAPSDPPYGIELNQDYKKILKRIRPLILKT